MKFGKKISFLKTNHFWILGQKPLMECQTRLRKMLLSHVPLLKNCILKIFFDENHRKKNKYIFKQSLLEKEDVGVTKIYKTHKIDASELSITNDFCSIQNLKNYPSVQYSDFAGIKNFLSKIQELIEWPLRFSRYYKKVGISPPRGVLLSGPPGTGKTYLAHVVAGEMELPLFYISVGEIFSSTKGKSEEKIRKIFNQAQKCDSCIIFIDEIDLISTREETISKDVNKRITRQLIQCLGKLDKKNQKNIIVLGATNCISTIDRSLRKQGQFVNEIKFSLPDYKSRLEILSQFTFKLVVEDKINLEPIAFQTKGFTSGDLCELVKIAGVAAISRYCAKIFKGRYRMKNFDIPLKIQLNQIDFERSRSLLSSKIFFQEFSFPPKVSWKEIGALKSTRKILSKYIIEPIKNPSKNPQQKKQGFGILLYGPPGCGKTLIAQATAYESGATLISIKGPEILDKFLGESEKAIRMIFEKARASSPSIIFFDEFDSIATKRSSSEQSSQHGASDRVVNQLLTEMDGIEKNHLVFFIGATNRPDIIDKAILRPGRIDKLLFIPFPDPKEKLSIIKTISRKLKVLPYLNFISLSRKINFSLSGADLSFCTEEAILNSKEKKITYCVVKNYGAGFSVEKCMFLALEDFFKGITNVLGHSFS